MSRLPPICTFFFFNDTATTEIYTLSLHDALPICPLSTPALQKITAATCIESSTRMGNSMFAAAALKTGMKEGVAASYDRLAELLASLGARGMEKGARERWAKRTVRDVLVEASAPCLRACSRESFSLSAPTW